MSEQAHVAELTNGDYVQIVWPNGSSLSGFASVYANGMVILGFGPENEDLTRWIDIGFLDDLQDFIKAGSIRVTHLPGE